MACFRLFTFRPEPLFKVPFFRPRMADFTLLDAFFPYFAMSPPPRGGRMTPTAVGARLPPPVAVRHRGKP
jgi:hypothetical protein